MGFLLVYRLGSREGKRMRSVHSVSLLRRSVLAAALLPRTWCILLLMILGGFFFENHLWLFGSFLALPKTFAATSCEGELPEDADPPPVAIGERLFLETRF